MLVHCLNIPQSIFKQKIFCPQEWPGRSDNPQCGQHNSNFYASIMFGWDKYLKIIIWQYGRKWKCTWLVSKSAFMIAESILNQGWCTRDFRPMWDCRLHILLRIRVRLWTKQISLNHGGFNTETPILVVRVLLFWDIFSPWDNTSIRATVYTSCLYTCKLYRS